MRNVAIVMLLVVPAIAAQPAPSSRHNQEPGFHLSVPAHTYDAILARPEVDRVTLSVLAYRDLEVQVEYGIESGRYDRQLPVTRLKPNEPSQLVLDHLCGDSQYFYRLRTRAPSVDHFDDAPECSFHTARAPGKSFVFTLTADSHLDEHTSSDVYLRTLANINADHPDFHIDMGNAFMTDKHPSAEEAAAQYLAQRYYFGQIGPRVPLLLALGTHDGENVRDDDGTADCVAVWANHMRTKLFPNPEPDSFYSGNSVAKPHRGLLQDYFSWTWGDATFIVLDPFGYSAQGRGMRDGWGWSLGQAQYLWLKKTLEQSKSRYKFVFIHNLLRGDTASRGGIEFAQFNEWGGKNPDGTDGFAVHRLGWETSVHQLLVKNHVTAVFRAHDNFYAHQELDGIAYQMIPQPSFAGNDRIRDLDNYGYKLGTFFGNSGHVRVVVGADRVQVEYVRSQPLQLQGQISDSYSLPLQPR